MRFAIRVKPGARKDAVGGRWGNPDHPALVVTVTASAVAGKANAAVCKALAAVFGVRQRDIHIVSGERSRDKIVEIDIEPRAGIPRLAELLAK